MYLLGFNIIYILPITTLLLRINVDNYINANK